MSTNREMVNFQKWYFFRFFYILLLQIKSLQEHENTEALEGHLYLLLITYYLLLITYYLLLTTYHLLLTTYYLSFRLSPL